MMATAYSGNFYTVLNSQMPTTRVEKIFATFEPVIVFSTDKLITKLPSTTAKIFKLEELENLELNENILEKVSRKISYMDILYVLFTSGSTGIPKGVTIGQRSVIEFTSYTRKIFNVDENDIIANQAPFHFDNSVVDIYQMLATGATLHLIPDSNYIFPAKVLQYLEENRISMIFWVPSILVRVANFGVLNDYNIDCLKKVLFCGEVMPVKQLNQWQHRLPKAIFANFYGPTEITVSCTYYVIDREFKDSESIPIGFPFKSDSILLLNENNQLAKNSEQAELYVRGSSLSYGYYNNPEKTLESFVQNPIRDYPEIVYRTGDLVHLNERHELVFDGRKDFQIKHLGYRIELGEIETAVNSLNEIESSCCLHNKKKNELCLCYVGNISSSDIISKLSQLLPKYMIPTRFEKLDQMPSNLNGKIDRNFLKEKFCE